MRRSPRSVLFVLALVVAVFAAACGGSGSSATEVASGDGATDQSEESSSSSPSDSGDEVEESPIGDLLGEVFGIPVSDTGALDDFFNDLSRQAEVKIAECMLGEGFEYTVVDYGELGGINIIEDENREYAEEYGFGITSNPFEESIEAFESFEDPNEDYVSSLSPGEQEAYYSTLYGADSFDTGPDGESAPQAFQPSGCQGEAFEEVFSFAEVFDEFNDEFEAIEEARLADPRIVDAASGWSECMAAAGFSYTNVEGAASDIRRRYETIVNNPDAAQDPADGGSSVEVSGGDGDDTFFFGPANLKPEYQAQVDVLAEEERAIATASWDCNEDFREIETAVRIEYEQKFVDENGAAIRAAVGE